MLNEIFVFIMIVHLIIDHICFVSLDRRRTKRMQINVILNVRVTLDFSIFLCLRFGVNVF